MSGILTLFYGGKEQKHLSSVFNPKLCDRIKDLGLKGRHDKKNLQKGEGVEKTNKKVQISIWQVSIGTSGQYFIWLAMPLLTTLYIISIMWNSISGLDT